MSKSTPQRAKTERASTSGSDILSRMLQLEKMGQRRQDPSASPKREPTLPASPQQSASPIPASSSASRQMEELPPLQSLQRMHKSSESASHSLANKTEALSVADQNTKLTPNAKPSNSDICRSPSWSDYRGNKQKKESRKMEKEQKEIEKRTRKEEERHKAAELKAAKRLRKRPPAAMDTQRMPAALLRASSPGSRSESQSPSGDYSRRSSWEGRRSSITSLVSFFGLSKDHSSKMSERQRSPSPTFQPISSIPPQIGRLRAIDHSRHSSSDTFGIAMSDDEDCVKDLVSFAYQVQASPDEVEVKKVKGVRISLPANVMTTPPPSHNDETNTQTKAIRTEQPVNFSRRPLASRRGSTEEGYFSRQRTL